MIPDHYVIYRTFQAAADMFLAMQLVQNRLTFRTPDYIDQETASANLEIAVLRQALDAEA